MHTFKQDATRIGAHSLTIRRRMHGAAIAEAVAALPILLVVMLGIIQLGLIYQAKATVNHASLQAARAGAVANADVAAIRRGLARGLVPLHSPDSTIEGVARKLVVIERDLATSARIRILNPTREAFADFGNTVDGRREIPNDHLHTRSTAIGTRSGVNIQDANLLRVEVTYGVPLRVPLVSWFISRVLLAAHGVGIRHWDAFEQHLLRNTRLPTVGTATVRMQTPAYLNDHMIARSDLISLPRVPANSRPPGDTDRPSAADDEEAAEGTSERGGDEEGRSLASGAFGFHGDHPETDPQGGGTTPGSGSDGTGVGSEAGAGGEDRGSPTQCPSSSETSTSSSGATSAASLPGNTLPGLSVGNPIHVATGNKYQAEIDLEPLPGKLGLMFARHYNSAESQRVGVFGAGWRHAYEAEVLVDAEHRNGIKLIQADGRLIVFRESNEGSQGTHKYYRAARAADGVLRRLHDHYRWIWNDGRELHFDGAGRLTRIRDRGDDLELIYRDGRLVRVKDPQQRTLELSYYANGRVASIHAPAGFAARHRYDEHGNLAEVLHVDGSARLYRYEDQRFPHHLTRLELHGPAVRDFGQQRAHLKIAAWAYDDQGRAILSTHPNEVGKVKLEYGNGFTDVTDAFGRTTRYEFERIDGTARITAIRGPGCSSCGIGNVEYAYGDHFTITDVKVAHEPSLHYRYDSQSRIVEISRTDLEGSRRWLTRFDYEGDSRLPAVIQRPSVKPGALYLTRIVYDEHGNPRHVTETGYSPTSSDTYERIARTTHYVFDGSGRLMSIDGPIPDASVRYSYDVFGRLRTIVRGDQTTQMLDYDAAGRITAALMPNGAQVEAVYDARGRIESIRRRIGNTSDTVFYGYDELGRLTEIRDSSGRHRELQYDAAGRVNGSRSDSLREQITFTTDNLPTQWSWRTPDLLNTFHFTYDSQRRLIEIRDGSGPPLRQVQYLDADPRPDSIIDPLGAETRLGYDALGRLTAVLTPDGALTRITLNEAGKVKRIDSPNGASTRYIYDDFGRPVREISADRGTSTYTYDSADRLITRTDARGLQTRYAYDASGRLLRIDRPEGAATFKYNRGRLVAIEDAAASESYSYDDAGRLIQHSWRLESWSYSITYEYTPDGRLHRKRLPSGESILYSYNQAGRLVALERERFLKRELLLKTDHGVLSPHTFDRTGELLLGNGLITRTALDRETGDVAYRSTDGVTAFAYRRNASGRIVEIRSPDNKGEYHYDTAGRLQRVGTKGKEALYQYDGNGNRIHMSRSDRDNAFSALLRYAPHSNRLLSIESSEFPPTRYEYDPSGHPVAVGNRRYEYDSAGRLIRLYDGTDPIAEYRYNHRGERVQKDVFSDGKRVRTFYLYENRKLVAEADERGRITREYLHVGSHPSIMLADGAVYWIHTDHLGTPHAMTDRKRRIVWSAIYDEFGAATVDDDPDRDGKRTRLNLRFPGQYADLESGIHYNYLRYYDPATGRYTTPDPLGIVDGVNTFSYVHGDPIRRSDSLGLYDEMVHYYMTYFLALVAGLPQDTAQTIALAAAYVDENPLTRPVNFLAPNYRALPLYHFVKSDKGPLYGDSTTDPLTRFYEPSSTQLENLHASTNRARLRELWVETHPSPIPGLCPVPDFAAIDRARYQLYGEYLHAYQDTFAHRDILNVPYGVRRRADTYPAAILGHVGLYGISYEQPDRTYNQDEDDHPPTCHIRYFLGGTAERRVPTREACDAIRRDPGVATTTFEPRATKCTYVYFRGPEDLLGHTVERRGLTEQQCREEARARRAVSVHFLPEGDLWAYNELRTLRMESEIFRMLTTEFATQIAENREKNGARVPKVTWEQLAGRTWDANNPEANARIGLDQPYSQWAQSQGLSEAATVLQRYNASDAKTAERLRILNDWLESKGFKDANGNALRIPAWDEVEHIVDDARKNNIGWIPARSFEGVLLPSDA